jgi:hypothetical protein
MNRSQQLFEDRYGAGSYSRLLTMLEQPCTTYASIAEHFGVSRERVRQWHLRLCPAAPRGHERQRQCALLQSKRRLLQQPLFRTFYRHARAHFEPGRFVLIAGREGFRTRSVLLDGHRVSIRRASIKAVKSVATYELSGGAADVDYLYYRLTPEEFLFVPRAMVPAPGALYRSDTGSPFEAYRNNFSAAFEGAQLSREAS